MKRIILIAAACAALASCTKAETETVNVTEPSVGTSFEKGQTVTLNVNAGTTTKVTSELNADGQTVDFKWAAEDKIKVTVKGKDAEFTLTSGAGGSSAVFEGVMPEFGDTFDVQYPVTDPDISTQNYSSTEAIPHDKMKFTATGCSFASPSFTLTAANAALRLNLYGSKPIGKIVVSDGVESTYTLTCGEPGIGITPGTTAETATPFFIVVPAGEYKFSAEIFDNSLTPASICKFEPSAARIFAAGNVLNMPAKEVKQSLPEKPLSGVFSVSATDKVHFSKGNLRYTVATGEWSFYDNQYECGPSTYAAGHDAEISLFTWGYGTWSTIPNTKECGSSFTDWGTKVGDGNTWRTLNKDEWTYLIARSNSSLYKKEVSVCDNNNCVVLAPDNWDTTTYPLQSSYNDSSTPLTWSQAEALGLVCLPAAGLRERGSSVAVVGTRGSYWSSTHYDDEKVYYLYFANGLVSTFFNEIPSIGHSVRLVCVAQ